jgi:adenylosuccinate synthase
MVDVVATVSIISSVFSIILAVYAIQFSRRVEERLKNNFLILKDTIEANQEQAQECLSNIDREAEAIKNTVDQSHEKLHEALKDIKIKP